MNRLSQVALGVLLLPFGAPAVLTVAVGLVWEVVLISGGLIAALVSALLSRVNGANTKGAEPVGAEPAHLKGIG